MPEPLVSVIIPTFNRLEYVQQTIDSVLAQTYSKTEVLVIDDGSMDGSRDKLPHKYAGRIEYHWQENQGESAARNRGLEMASGLYIAFLDSDDLWHPKKIASLVSLLEKEKHQRSVAAFSSVWLIDSQGKQISPSPVGRATKLSRRKLIDFFAMPRIYAPPSNLMIRGGAIKELEGFDTKIQFGEDWDLVIRLRHLGEILYFDQPLLYYRLHATQQGIPKPERVSKILSDHLRIIEKNAVLMSGSSIKFIRNAQALTYEKAAGWCFALDLQDKGFGYLKQAGALQRKFVSPQRIAQNVGRWVASGVLERRHSPDAAEKYFISEFLPTFLERAPQYLDSLPNADQLMGWFYHNLAFLVDAANEEGKRHFLKKSVQFQPQLILTSGTLSGLLLSRRWLAHA